MQKEVQSNVLTNLAKLAKMTIMNKLNRLVDMISVNATDFKNNLGQFLQKIYAEPVVINKMGRPTAVLLSYEEYERLTVQAGSGSKTVLSEKEQTLEEIQREFKRVRARGAEVKSEQR